MNKNILGIFSILIAFVVITNTTYAEQGEGSLKAHVHGLSELTIAMENNVVEIQLTSPAMNLVGFEHSASSKTDIAAVENAESILRQHKALFSFSDAGCKHLETNVDTSTLIDSDNHEHDHHHQSHKDEHHHDHEDHDEDESHSEIVANYKYSCKDSSKLSSIEVGLFESFHGIHKIQAMWVVHAKQGSKELRASDTVIGFR